MDDKDEEEEEEEEDECSFTSYSSDYERHKNGNRILGRSMIKEEITHIEKESMDKKKKSNKEEGWINMYNFDTYALNLDINEKFTTQIACITTDYAMQNVLYQMGLHVITIDGFKIKTLRLWGKFCTSCYFFMKDKYENSFGTGYKNCKTNMTPVLFCSKCGNNTIRKVSVHIDNELEKLIVDVPRIRSNHKNSIFSIPKRKMRKGKLQDKFEIFREDELLIGGRQHFFKRQQKLYENQKNLKDPFSENNIYDYKNWSYRVTQKNGNAAVTQIPKIIVGGRRKVHRKFK